MKISRKVIGVLISFSILALAGCGTDKRDETKGNTIGPVSGGSSEGEKLIESATANGSVISFEESGCTITPVETKDDGRTAVQASPGNEDKKSAINIKYGSGCVFQNVKLDRTTGKASFSEVSYADVKKQSHLLIYGDVEDAHNVTASKILIIHFE